MPFGGTNQEQIEECVSQVSGINSHTGKPPSESEKIAICKSSVMQGKSFLFSEFIEVKSESGEYYVKGVASSSNPDLGRDIVTVEAMREIVGRSSTVSRSCK